MLRAIGNKTGTFLSVFVSVLLLVFGESLLVSSIYTLGPVVTFAIFVIFFYCFSEMILHICNSGIKANKWPLFQIANWVAKKKVDLDKRKYKIIKNGKLIGIFSFSLFAGPVPTSVLISVLGFKGFFPHMFLFVVNCAFFLAWITIYSLGITTIIRVFN
jgi:hypothetical protein